MIELGGNATTQTDDALTVCGKQFFIDSRLEIESFETCTRSHLDQVLKPSGVLTEQSQVVTLVAFSAPATFCESTFRRNVGFVSDDRIDVMRFASSVKFQRAMQVAMVGDSKCIHPVLDRSLYQSGDRAGAVEQAVMGMAVKMGKFPVRHDIPFQLPGCQFYSHHAMFAMRRFCRTGPKKYEENVSGGLVWYKAQGLPTECRTAIRPIFSFMGIRWKAISGWRFL